MKLLEFNRKVINRNANGKILWQPRIAAYFDDRDFNKIPYDEPYSKFNRYDVYRAIGCSDRSYQFNACMKPVYRNGIESGVREIDNTRVEFYINTPLGNLNAIYRRNSSNPGSYPEKWYVTTEEELKLLIYIEESTDYIFDKDLYSEMYLKYADLGLPALFFPRVNIQKLFHEYMGIEETFYALQDYPDTVEAYFKVLSETQSRFLDTFLETPFEWINFGDNIHCNLLPANLFEKYVLPEYLKRTDRLRKANIFTSAHWDGDVKTLLPYSHETGLDAIEAITPFPQGDVSLAEAKKHMKDMFLMDGIAALLFNEYYPLEMLAKQVNECLELFAPNIILGISDELPSTGSLDRVKYVKELVDEYNDKQ